MIITALKAFDIVYVMTSGHFDTAGRRLPAHPGAVQLQQLRAGPAPIGIVLLLAIIPVMAFNVRRFRAQEAIR